MNAPFAKQMQGFSLIELMIALTLGLVIGAAVVQTFITNNRSIVFQREAITTQEQGRVAVDMISRYVRMAGYQESNLAKSSLDSGINGTDNGNKDSLIVRFEAGGAMSAPIADCLGNSTSTSGTELVSEFKVNANNDLVCNNESGEIGNNAVNVDDGVLANRVEELSILFGEDTDDDQAANRYLPAASVAAMSSVVAVRVCLLLQSRDNMLDKATDYTNCADATVTPASSDKRMRRRISSTITLRNRTGGGS